MRTCTSMQRILLTGYIAVACAGVSLSARGSEPGDAAGLRFADVTSVCGVDMTMTCGATPSRHILEVNGGGVALFDYDNDGDLDLFLANGASMKDPEHGPGSRMYANEGDGTFVDVTKKVGLALTRWAMGVAVGDYDDDGYDDVYVTCYGPNVLLRNVADGAGGRRFVDVTKKAGVGDDRWSTSAAFGDVDADGDLDLYVVNYLDFDARNPPRRTGVTFLGAGVMPGPTGLTPQADVLYQNQGDGTFQDVTQSSGCVPQQPGYGLGVVMLDFDRDGTQDIFVGNDSTQNFLFHNLGGGQFKDIGAYSGIASNSDGANQASMGIAIGDVDGNGLPDVFTTNFSSDTNTLHLNLGDDFFDDRTSQFGLGMISRPFLSWGTGFYDFDCDGDEDLFIACGHVYPEAAEHMIDSEYAQPPLLFERVGKRFQRRLSAGEIFQTKYSARSCAFGDIDSDGDVDVVMTTLNGVVHVFRNDSPRRRNRLVVELKQPDHNHRGLGAMIELAAGSDVQRRWIHGGSYQSFNAPVAYFALQNVNSNGDVRIRVTWPDGRTSEHTTTKRNCRLIIKRGAEQVTARSLR